MVGQHQNLAPLFVSGSLTEQGHTPIKHERTGPLRLQPWLPWPVPSIRVLGSSRIPLVVAASACPHIMPAHHRHDRDHRDRVIPSDVPRNEALASFLDAWDTYFRLYVTLPILVIQRSLDAMRS